MLANGLLIAFAIVLNGGDFYFEWPAICQGWRLPELLDFFQQVKNLGRPIYKCVVDGCQYGLKTKDGKHVCRSGGIFTPPTLS